MKDGEGAAVVKKRVAGGNYSIYLKTFETRLIRPSATFHYKGDIINTSPSKVVMLLYILFLGNN